MELSCLLAMDVVGTIAFAIAGAMLAIKKEMDIFGVNILAIMTAAGGGVLRDVLIGEIPPKFFQNPVYTLLMVISASLVFFLVYFGKMGGQLFSKVFEKVLFLSDTLGLAAFTVDGVSVGMHTEYGDNLFLGYLPESVAGSSGMCLQPKSHTFSCVIFMPVPRF